MNRNNGKMYIQLPFSSAIFFKEKHIPVKRFQSKNFNANFSIEEIILQKIKTFDQNYESK